jgi:cyclic pyranopterin phosphate synthase
MARREQLTHLDAQGEAHMVDVGDKPDTLRTAVAAGSVHMQPETLAQIQAGALHKGDALTVARIAGIMAAKRTSELIPLCHPLPLHHIEVEITLDAAHSTAEIRAHASIRGKTGVEMEALTAVAVAALTLYDMAKAIDRGMRIGDIRLLEKRGGMHGDYTASEREPAVHAASEERDSHAG